MFIVELITTHDDRRINLNHRDDWEAQIEVQFLYPLVTFEDPLSIHAVYLTHSSGNEYGYLGTPPLRLLKGTVSYKKGDKVRQSINLYDELKKHDPDHIESLTPGAASIQIKGAVWPANDPPKEFVLKRAIIIQ